MIFARNDSTCATRAIPLDRRTESLATVLGPFQRRLSRVQRGRDADLAAVIGKLVSARLSSVIKPSSNDAWRSCRAFDRTLSPHRPVSASVRRTSSASWARDPNAFVPSPWLPPFRITVHRTRSHGPYVKAAIGGVVADIREPQKLGVGAIDCQELRSAARASSMHPSSQTSHSLAQSL